MEPSNTPDGGLPPGDAFSVLGNETRLEILRVLGESDDPLSFTALRDAVGLRQGGRFNYHLDMVVGHFVRRTEDGYELAQPGRRVIEAVLSGAVTHDPVLEPTGVDFECLLCGGSIAVSYRAERVELYCTECPGQYGQRVEERESSFDGPAGYLGGYQIPPAGVDGRSPSELLAASSLWSHLENVALANDLCPRCGAVVDHEITVCDAHDRTEGLCPACDNRHAVQVTQSCANCHHTHAGMAINVLGTRLELRRFVAAQGIDPIVEGYRWGWDCEEDVHSVDPFRADFTFTIADESITLHTGEGLEVLEVR